jgi:hypothetical protein
MRKLIFCFAIRSSGMRHNVDKRRQRRPVKAATEVGMVLSHSAWLVIQPLSDFHCGSPSKSRAYALLDFGIELHSKRIDVAIILCNLCLLQL